MQVRPLDEYARRRQAREADAAAREHVHVRLGNSKVAIFIAILIYWAVTLNGDPSAWFYAVAIALFVALSVWHERVLRAMARANTAAAFYRAGSDRIELRYFGGMTRDEIACACDLTLATVKRDLRLAEAWLRRDLRGQP